MSELKYKVGDEVLVRGRIAMSDDSPTTLPYRVEFSNARWLWLPADIVGPANPEAKTVPADPHGWRFFHDDCSRICWAFPPQASRGFVLDLDCPNEGWSIASDSLTFCLKCKRKESSASEILKACGMPPGYPQPKPEFPHPMYLMWKGAVQ